LFRILVIGYFYDDVFLLSSEGFYLMEIIFGLSILGVLFGIIAFCGIRRRSVDSARFYSLCKHGQVFTLPFILLLGLLVQIKEDDIPQLLGMYDPSLEYLVMSGAICGISFIWDAFSAWIVWSTSLRLSSNQGPMVYDKKMNDSSYSTVQTETK
jgi:hypothetical protein